MGKQDPKKAEKIKTDLDALFSKGKQIAKKKKKVTEAKKAEEKAEEPQGKRIEAPKPKKAAEKMSNFDKKLDELKEADQKSGKQRRVTEDGFKIYTLEELGVGKGGDTDLCPFDCDCCF